MILFTPMEACKLLREHDTLIENKNGYEIYRSLSAQQAENIALLIEQMNALIKSITD